MRFQSWPCLVILCCWRWRREAERLTMAKRTCSCEQDLDPTILATRSHATQLSGLGDDHANVLLALLLILNSVEQYDLTHPSIS